MSQALWVRKSDLSTSQIVEIPSAPLGDLGVRLKVDSFAVTANNVTYAVIGDMFHYWNFFPAPDGWGIVPMWGHATVAASKCPDIAVGERVYGYLPAATHLDVVPGKISEGGFTDMAEHRQPMSPFYNQYSRLAADPEHDPAHEDARMIFGPLFKTGFLIEAFYRRNDWFGAEALVMTSASSKTAMALAHCAKIGSPKVRRIGLTSPSNIAFVKASGLYDEVVAYDAIDALARVRAVSVDFAGNAAVLRTIHTHFGDALRFSSTVGMTHVGARAGEGAPLPGPTPTLFFAPTEALETIKAMGPAGFAQAVGAAWTSFIHAAEGFVTVEHRSGLDAADAVFKATLAGQQSPEVGIVVRV
jgi:Protein of unknown function (DUF2855)